MVETESTQARSAVGGAMGGVPAPPCRVGRPPDHLPAEILSLLPPGDPFERVMALQGEVFRDVPGRRTLRVRLGDESYFVKQHLGVGWREIFKNLFSGKWPVVDASVEWRAIERLRALGIPTTPGVAYASRGSNPARRRSFVMTRDLGDIVSLEDHCRDWPHSPPPLAHKRAILAEVARIARTLHEHGLNHRDFYLCHFCLDGERLRQGEILIYLMDLHRVGVRRVTSRRDRMKDLAALYFSALDIGLSRRDCLRFIRLYRGSLRRTLVGERSFWRQVQARARRLYHKFHGRWPRTPFDETGNLSGTRR